MPSVSPFRPGAVAAFFQVCRCHCHRHPGGNSSTQEQEGSPPERVCVTLLSHPAGTEAGGHSAPSLGV